MTQYFYTSEGHDIARLNATSSEYNNAEILRDGQWEGAFPADLLWNMEPVTKDEAIQKMLIWKPAVTTKAEALRLLDMKPVSKDKET